MESIIRELFGVRIESIFRAVIENGIIQMLAFILCVIGLETLHEMIRKGQSRLFKSKILKRIQLLIVVGCIKLLQIFLGINIILIPYNYAMKYQNSYVEYGIFILMGLFVCFVVTLWEGKSKKVEMKQD